MYKGSVRNVTSDLGYEFVPYDQFIIEMLEAGGILQQTINRLDSESARQAE